MKLIIATLLLAMAGPHEDNINTVLNAFREHRGKEPKMTTLPISCNGANTNNLYSGNSAKQARIVYGDSMWTQYANRLGGSISEIASDINLKGYLCLPYDIGFANGRYPCDVEFGTVPRNWEDEGLIDLDEAWGSGAPTEAKFGHGRSFRVKNNTLQAIAYVYTVAFDRAELNLPTGTGVEFTCLLFYNKEGLSSDLDFVYRKWMVDGSDNRSVSGTDDGSFTLESGTGIGVVEMVFSPTGTQNDSGNAKIGFQIRITEVASTNETAEDDRIEILGHLLFQSEEVSGTNILEGSDGTVMCPIVYSGQDAGELLEETSNASRDALVAELGRILGNGTADSLEPVSAIDVFTGLNHDISGTIDIGLEALEDEWRETVIPDYSGSATLPDVNYWAMYSYGDETQQARMATQAQNIHTFCIGADHRAFYNLHGYFGGVNPGDVTGNDPFGDAHASYTMDNASPESTGLHTDDESSAEAMMQAILAISHADNLVAGACTVSSISGNSRSRSSIRTRPTVLRDRAGTR